ncbi:MAG: aminotransferase class I/II-fold pyridoxal phosphate-dependent enzyme, partial [Bdellovibrionales bacterium]|nr:aminotransferase class I/II-fold pyridoxal phosphate-dependent enzyme [Bdellovibrionales bacterium]
MKQKSTEFGFGTLAIHAGQSPDPSTGAVMQPVYQNSTYRQKTPGAFVEDYDYARSSNPTRKALEANIAALESGAFGISFSSGLASIGATIQLLEAGDHIVVCDDVYGGTFRILDKIFKQFSVEFTQVDMTDLGAFERAFTPKTKLVWVETPTNPMLKVIDISAASKLAKSHGALLAVDNTFCSPYLQQPLHLGADIVSHSTTKYIGGHSDLIGGALVVNDPDLADRLHYIQNAYGAVPGPWDCFLQLRSTKTLHLRMERHCENAKVVAEFLSNHPKIDTVIYPGLPSHPHHEVAKKQMKDFGGMVSCVIKGTITETRKFLEKLSVFSLAESLGGVESLVNHPAIMT